MVEHLGQLEQNSGVFSALLSLNRNTGYRRAISLICEIDVGLSEFLHLSFNSVPCLQKEGNGGRERSFKNETSVCDCSVVFFLEGDLDLLLVKHQL